MARPSKYKEYIEPHLDKIKQMALTMTDKDIASNLGVGYSNFMKYKKEHKELKDALKKGRVELCLDLKSTAIRIAEGYNYTETKVIKRINEDGDMEIVGVEEYNRYQKPDVASINLLLKNYDDNWANDPQNLKLKKQELELKRQIAEANNWEVNYGK